MSQFYHDAFLVPPEDWPWVKYFSPVEFADRDEGSVLVVPEFMDRMYATRVILAMPMIITRGYSTPEHNTAVGGVSKSAHPTGYGADIKCTDSGYRMRLIEALLAAGFQRIGIYDKHIHADCDPKLPPNVMWTGVSK